MERKYELTNETKEINCYTLHRIVAVRNFGNVKAGDKGGWIEKESNLSHDGDCWVFDNAMVFADAVVSGNANVGDSAMVFANAKVYDDARVYGSTYVHGYASMYENARVYGRASVCEHALVHNKAQVCGTVRVYGCAEVCGDAVVSTYKDYIVFKNWWSSGRYFTWTLSNNKWKVGCFYGTGEELIIRAYNNSERSGREYERIVRYVDEIIKDNQK